MKGSDTCETAAKILNIAAGVLSAVADGLTAYGLKDNNEHGNIVDGVIPGLHKYHVEIVQLGRIVKVKRIETK